MFSDDILAQLSRLNQQRLPIDHHNPSRDAPTVDADIVNPTAAEADEDVSQLPRGDEVTNGWGKHWIRHQPLSAIWSHGDIWLREPLVRLDQCRANPGTRSHELRAMWAHLPEQVLFLDLETCGFAGSMIFLVGVIHYDHGRFQLTQLLSRNYAEEKAMLQTLWSLAAKNRVLVTFNGKSFDWPMVHDRSTIHHLGCDIPAASTATSIPSNPPVPDEQSLLLTRRTPRPQLIHCDLLHHSRRRWKNRLPNCKLQTLERLVCRRHRSDDIPGREIPAAYHDFVRSGDAWLVRSVLHHNALDLVTLLQLSMLLLPAEAA